MGGSIDTVAVPQDTVILHCVGRGKTLPSVSPFVLKLETYLRMADISYQINTKKPFGPNGKMPWITLNGATMIDSQLIIEYLNKKYSKNFWGNASAQDKAMAASARLMLEEHFIWGLTHWRFIEGIHTLDGLMVETPIRMKLIKFVMPGRIKKGCNAQGLGRHDYDNMVHLVETDLRIISDILGDKDFILGNEPCEADCGIFGILAQVFWAMPESPYEKLANSELKNLKGYCMRMREKFWPDWDDCIYKEPPKK